MTFLYKKSTQNIVTKKQSQDGWDVFVDTEVIFS